MNNPEKRKRGRPFGSKVASGKKDGRPVFIPTEDQKFLVTMMSSTGVPHERQAKALGVNSKTLRKYFKEVRTIIRCSVLRNVSMIITEKRGMK